MALGVLLAIVFVGYGLFSLVGKSIDASRQRRIAEAEASALKQKESDLSAKLTMLNTANGEEAALREKFPVVKPGEHVVVITEDTESASQVAAVGTAPASNGFWQFFKNLFKKEQ